MGRKGKPPSESRTARRVLISDPIFEAIHTGKSRPGEGTERVLPGKGQQDDSEREEIRPVARCLEKLAKVVPNSGNDFDRPNAAPAPPRLSPATTRTTTTISLSPALPMSASRASQSRKDSQQAQPNRLLPPRLPPFFPFPPPTPTPTPKRLSRQLRGPPCWPTSSARRWSERGIGGSTAAAPTMMDEMAAVWNPRNRRRCGTENFDEVRPKITLNARGVHPMQILQAAWPSSSRLPREGQQCPVPRLWSHRPHEEELPCEV
ncbi:hypothetical protein GGR56DRAFT_464783 [Xylariaceae sp. FL0804]|nr:hypothetical protein GGR56DRAFT_464783 [Xylariaceae sp. FL0804]